MCFSFSSRVSRKIPDCADCLVLGHFGWRFPCSLYGTRQAVDENFQNMAVRKPFQLPARCIQRCSVTFISPCKVMIFSAACSIMYRLQYLRVKKRTKKEWKLLSEGKKKKKSRVLFCVAPAWAWSGLTSKVKVRL